MGYSFCNCKNLFYTNYDNIGKDVIGKRLDVVDHIQELKNIALDLKPGWRVQIYLPDPFFCEWGRDPHEFLHWNPRRYYQIWDVDQFCQEAENAGLRVVSAYREFGVKAEHPQTFKITLQKPIDMNDPLNVQMYTPETRLRCSAEAAKKHLGDKPVHMVEVGTLLGNNAKLMLDEWPQIEKIHLVDNFMEIWDIPDQEEHNENLEYVRDRFKNNKKVNIIIKDSVEASKEFEDESLDFVYIDADHLYEPVKADITAWLPKVKKGGVIGGHDYDYHIRPSVKEAVDEAFGDKVQEGENQNTLHDWWVINE